MAEAKTSKEIETMTQTKIALACALALLCALLAAPLAAADPPLDPGAFGLEPGSFDADIFDQNGDFEAQAGAHPFGVSTEFALKTIPNPIPGDDEGLPIAAGAPLRNVTVEAPPGLAGDPTATPRCTLAEFLISFDGCPDEDQVGIAETEIDLFSAHLRVPSAVYNVQPAPGQPARFAFRAILVPAVAVPSIRSESDYGLDFNVLNISTTAPVTANKFTFWGVPASPSHDSERGNLFFGFCHGFTPLPCHSNAPLQPFLTNPTNCAHGPFSLDLEVQSWLGESDSEAILTHDDEGNPAGVTRCDRVPFEPSIDATITSDNAESPSGLDFELNLPATGIKNPDGLAQSQLKKAVVKLPEGVTLNPSVAEGLEACTPGDFARESLDSEAGEGCPNGSKIGTVITETPVLPQGEIIEGELFIGEPDDPSTTTPGAENPFDSLLSLYLVMKLPERGVFVKVAGKVEPDPLTGQVTATFDDLPQVPFSSFKLHFREGGRAPLVSEPTCGEHLTEGELTPYSAPSEPVHVQSASLITHGVGGGPCPTGGIPSFEPGFDAGSINNNAASYTPFYLRLTRKDGEQDMTKFSSVLPPGVLGKLAEVSKCPEAAIAASATKTGRQELASPSCPAGSEIGRSLVGGGAGSVLTYVPGKLYLGGPYHGDPLSVVAITPAVAGPFDIGTVVVREALTLNPRTAEVEVDGAASDPIPHILKGIPLKLRDLRVYVDRPQFILNPTSCDPSSVKATVFGSYLDVFNPADDVPVDLSTRYQAANCLNLGFKPRLDLSLKGGTRRGGHPALTATYEPRAGDANIKGLVVRLPRSAFLDQAHIRTICTRVQFAADSCPPAAQYGYIKAFTPLLEEPLQGPVWLRSSNHKLPDLVFDLHGLVDVEVSVRLDSARGGIRATLTDSPDAPLSKVVLKMQGGKKGLIVNSRNLCGGANRANVRFEGHNGKRFNSGPLLRSEGCGKKARKKHGRLRK